MLKQYIMRFWEWYERHQTLNTAFVTLLFAWQLWHLWWLTTAVVVPRLGYPVLYSPSPLIKLFILGADLAEIPAIIGATLLYLNELRREWHFKNIGFLFLVNSQWLHILWITDEFVVQQFSDNPLVGFPFWLAWCAILIDYLELPVIVDTLKKTFVRLRQFNSKRLKALQ